MITYNIRTILVISTLFIAGFMSAQATKTSPVTDSVKYITVSAEPVNPFYSGTVPVSGEKTALYEEGAAIERSPVPGITNITLSAVPADTAIINMNEGRRKSLLPGENTEVPVTELKMTVVPINAPK